MISVIDINTSIVDTLRSALIGTPFEAIRFISQDITEGFERPGLKIDLDNMKLENLNADFKARAVTIRVYFFAKDLKQYKLENLEMQEIIENTFLKGVWINENYIPITDIEAEVVDTVLTVEFDINITAYSDDEPGELMEDLETEFKY